MLRIGSLFFTAILKQVWQIKLHCRSERIGCADPEGGGPTTKTQMLYAAHWVIFFEVLFQASLTNTSKKMPHHGMVEHLGFC